MISLSATTMSCLCLCLCLLYLAYDKYLSNNYVLSFAFAFDRDEEKYQFALAYPYSYSRSTESEIPFKNFPLLLNLKFPQSSYLSFHMSLPFRVQAFIQQLVDTRPDMVTREVVGKTIVSHF